MSKVRVYDLARELGLTNKELMDLLEADGLPVKSHASSLESDFAELIRDKVFASRRGAKPAVPKTPSAPGADAPTAAPRTAMPAALAEILLPAAPVVAPEPKAHAPEPPRVPPKEIHLKPPITVRDLADAMCRKPNELIGSLMSMNVFATINQVVDLDIVEKVCARHGIQFIRERRERPAKGRQKSDLPAEGGVDNEHIVPRPPVVAFLGHVDHGKTSLQDTIRKTEVAAGELGGITQSIGASVVHWHGKQVTMIDTPGHEAFTAMRARGASATDIVILVVAADDGVMPQTEEAVNHARAANAPIIVAMNKIDLPGANPDRVQMGLQQAGVNPEAWGGDVGVVPVSAVTKQGIEDLLERILLESEMLELKGNPDLPAKGVVIEAQLEGGMGPTAHILVRNGTLHVGDAIVCGRCSGRVKAMIDYFGQRVKAAGPSTPVKVLGLSNVPEAGDLLEVYADEKEAKAVAEVRAHDLRQGGLSVARHGNIEEMFKKLEADAKAELKIILKTDVRGSVEAIQDAMKKIKSEKITLNIIHAGVGEITENDVLLAATAGAVVMGFHVRAMPGVNAVARRETVEIRLYGIIYELLDDLEQILLGRIAPEVRDVRTGAAEIIQIFDLSRSGRICGSRVNEGSMRVGANATVRRGTDIIYKGRIQSLRRFTEDVREVKNGFECGIRLDNFEDFEVGDVIEVFTVEKVTPTL